LLETVIGLAPNLFYGTTIPASLLFFKAKKDEKRKKQILFIDASKRFSKGKAQNNLSKSDLDDIYEVYESIGKKDKKDIAARLVPLSEIEDNNFDLNIGRYLKAEASEVVDVSEALSEFNESRMELEKIEKDLITKLKAAGYA
jgi:type I restriction enzyme M protein